MFSIHAPLIYESTLYNLFVYKSVYLCNCIEYDFCYWYAGYALERDAFCWN